MTSFRELHRGERLLVLPNAWDAITARVVEEAGAAAVATSSAAVAWVHGAPDGEYLSPVTLIETVSAIRRVIRVPLSVDLEAGFGREPEQIADLISAMLASGVDGINLEDGASPPELLAAKIAVARRVAAAEQRDLFINARTDVYLRQLGGVDETLRRARLYREAGADGLFVPRLAATGEIEAIAARCGLPLNLMLVPGLPDAPTLHRLGVRRLSAGTSIAQAALGLVRRAAKELLATGQSPRLFEDAFTYAEANALVSGR